MEEISWQGILVMFKCLFVAFMSLIDAQCLQLISIRARTLDLLHLAAIPELISIHKKTR